MTTLAKATINYKKVFCLKIVPIRYFGVIIVLLFCTNINNLPLKKIGINMKKFDKRALVFNRKWTTNHFWSCWWHSQLLCTLSQSRDVSIWQKCAECGFFKGGVVLNTLTLCALASTCTCLAIWAKSRFIKVKICKKDQMDLAIAKYNSYNTDRNRMDKQVQRKVITLFRAKQSTLKLNGKVWQSIFVIFLRTYGLLLRHMGHLSVNIVIITLNKFIK